MEETRIIKALSKRAEAGWAINTQCCFYCGWLDEDLDWSSKLGSIEQYTAIVQLCKQHAIKLNLVW